MGKIWEKREELRIFPGGRTPACLEDYISQCKYEGSAYVLEKRKKICTGASLRGRREWAGQYAGQEGTSAFWGEGAKSKRNDLCVF